MRSDTPTQLRLRGPVRWPEVGRYELWCGLAGEIIRRDTCTMSRRAVLLEVPWLPWQLPQLVLY